MINRQVELGVANAKCLRRRVLRARRRHSEQQHWQPCTPHVSLLRQGKLLAARYFVSSRRVTTISSPRGVVGNTSWPRDHCCSHWHISAANGFRSNTVPASSDALSAVKNACHRGR